MTNIFENYGQFGSMAHHDIVIMEHFQPDKRKRRMCRCGCRKKSTHVQSCNGVVMNSGCKEYLQNMAKRMDKIKQIEREKRNNLYERLGLGDLK